MPLLQSVAGELGRPQLLLLLVGGVVGGGGVVGEVSLWVGDVLLWVVLVHIAGPALHGVHAHAL